MPSFSAFNDSVRCCCRTRRSCWMASFSAFNVSGCTTVRSGIVTSFFCQRNIFKTLIYRWYCYGLAGTAPNWPIRTRTKKCRKYTNLCLRFFLSYLRVFSAHYFANLSLPYQVPHVRVHMTSTPLPSPLPCVPSFKSREKKNVQNEVSRSFFPWRPLASNWLVCIHTIYKYNTQHAGCDALSAVSLYTDAFVSGF